MIVSCDKESVSDKKIVFLHHSTGEVIWFGKPPSLFKRGIRKFNRKLAYSIDRKARVEKLFTRYNKEHRTNYKAQDLEFPKLKPYGWKNNPFDYYNIWVKHAGNQPYMEEPTLEMLTKEYQVILFKHCYPVCNIEPDQDSSDINSEYPSLANYKLQYLAIRDKLHQFPQTKFIVFTGAAQVKNNVTEDQAARAREFFTWVINEWDLPQDNIYLWDLYNLETQGGNYFVEELAGSSVDSHPNKNFARKAADLLFNRIIDVIESDGKNSTIRGEKI